LIAATADQSEGIAWITGDDTQTTLNGNTSIDYGTGQANTNAMMAQDGYTGGAAQVCNDYTNTETGTGVYADWFLPSRDELELMYTNLHEQTPSIGGFDDGSFSYYWSSSEYNSEYNATLAWLLKFSFGYRLNHLKTGNYRVRAVRYF